MPRKHFVHRFKYSHDIKRKKFRLLLAAGKVKIVASLPNGIIYEEVGVKIRISRRGRVIVK